MEELERLRQKVKQIADILAEVESELTQLEEPLSQRRGAERLKETSPADEELRAEYERLYELFLSSQHSSVRDFLQSRSRAYLRAFCRANSLPLDKTKASKAKIAAEVENWFVQRKALAKRAT